MAAVVAKRKADADAIGSENEAVMPTKAALKPAKADATKKRRTTASAPAPVQKNTLDRWFGVAKKTAAPSPATKENELADTEDKDVDMSPVVRAPRVLKSASPPKSKGKSKKLVQRRILLSDQCRVCESAKTETSTRCERKCMDCEMTVHMSCYGMDDDEEVLPEKWRCRPCQATFELTEEKPEADGEEEMEEEQATEKGIPVHELRGQDGRYYGLYTCSDFAAVFLFLKRFRRLGLKLGVDVTVDTLAAALLAPRDHTILSELHTRLLQNIGATISKNGSWVDNIMRFLKASDYAIGGELVRRLAASGNANDWLETYYDVPVTDRVAILKVLCEAQFDENDALVEKLGHTETAPESLREETLGVDAAKRTYYLLEDPTNFADGSAWLCRCHTVDGSNWETVSDDLASLQSFVRALSYSTETLDLQLWQALATGVATSLERRDKKKRQQAERLARVPRMLRSTGLDMSSILPENGAVTATGRSLRTRRTVSYRTYESEDEDEEEDEEDEEHEEDEGDEEEENSGAEEEEGTGRPQRRVDRVERPTRSSCRLRRSPHRDEETSDTGDGNDDDEESAGDEEEDPEAASSDSEHDE